MPCVMLALWIGVLILLALAFVLIPCKGQKEGRNLAIVCFIALPVLAIILYWQLGASSALKDSILYQARSQEIRQEIEELGSSPKAIKAIKSALEQNPNDARGWFLLGKLELSADNEPDAEKAFAKAAKLAIDQEEVFPIEVQSMLAIVAFKSGDQKTALALWGKVLHSLPTESNEAQGLRKMLEKFQSQQAKDT